MSRAHHAPAGETKDERMQMMQRHHEQVLWIWWTLILLGAWLASSPLTFAYDLGAQAPAGGRWLPFSHGTRTTALVVSDVLCGLLLIVLGWRMLSPGRPIARWAACLVGVWLQFAPLLFWAPTAVVYLNDTLVGAFVIALTILIPGMPGMAMIMKPGPQVPPGWSYNPSSWPQRWIMIGLGFAGWLVSRYLAAFQLGYIPSAWDPFFGEGSRKVLTSEMSEMWPISDAGLGAVSYTFEFLMGWMGGPARWRTMPWMVLFFGILVVPLGLTHIVLVISQPVVVGHWCTLCLVAALIMLPMIPLTLDEVTAMCQFMLARMRAGRPFWSTFWFGDTIEGGRHDERSPPLASFPRQPGAIVRSAVWGVSAPWNLTVSALVGGWLMFAPSLLHARETAADNDHLAGPLAAVIAVIAMAEVARALRFLNVLCGLWLVLAPWLLSGASTLSTVSDIVCGLALIALSLRRGPVYERYGSWDAYVL